MFASTLLPPPPSSELKPMSTAVLPGLASTTSVVSASPFGEYQTDTAVRHFISFLHLNSLMYSTGIPGVFPAEGAALAWDENFQKKPAYNAMLNVLSNTNKK